MQIHESKEQIRVRAHQLWEQAGREHGHDLDHWLQAERECLLNSVAEAPLMQEVKHEAADSQPEQQPAKKAKTVNSVRKTPRKTSARSRAK
jgi:hypothetical protein